MEQLIREHERLATSANLSGSIRQIQTTLDQLTAARGRIESSPSQAAITLCKLQNPTQKCFDHINSNLKDIYKGQTRYQRAMEMIFKDKPVPTSNNDVLSTQTGLINRAITMHLLREGQFEVASQFILDLVANDRDKDYQAKDSETMLDEALGIDTLEAEGLRKPFQEMYAILREMRENCNLLPAIEWAKTNSVKLEHRGSNLEFDLVRMQFVHLFNEHVSREGRQSNGSGYLKALIYARENFGAFQSRYLAEISQLASAMAFQSHLKGSPYGHLFNLKDQWIELSGTFVREFCSLLGLSASSPLYLAVTAGAISLPTLLKLQTIMKDKRAEWTTAQELPVEIPLPASYLFHNIFVCPVSKEQTTDENPPMMMPCGHVVAQETLARMSKGTRFKCPYCPMESSPLDARKLFL